MCEEGIVMICGVIYGNVLKVLFMVLVSWIGVELEVSVCKNNFGGWVILEWVSSSVFLLGFNM